MLLSAVLALASAAPAATGGGATGSASLKLPRGARPTSMGEAYVAVASGADSILWNAAGLDQLRDLQANVGHLSYLDGITDDYIQIGRPIFGLGAWGFGVNYLYATDDAYDNWGNPLGSFNNFDFSAQLALAFELIEDLHVGGTYKILNQGYGANGTVAEQFSMGSGIDLGVQYRNLWKRLDLGLGVYNMGTPVAQGKNYTPLPLTLKLGFGLHIVDGWLLAVDYEHQPIDFFNKWHLGSEFSYPVGAFQTFARVGYTLGPQQDQGGLAGLSAGLGLALGSWQVDYAFVPQGDLGNTHRLSLTWSSWLF